MSDPCYNYTELVNHGEPSINTHYIHEYHKCDTNVTWSGWYRLFINGLNAHISEKCITTYGCGTHVTLWIPDGHPKVEDGVVTRDVCGHWNNYCCYHGSYPIKVKACPGNYDVYELTVKNILTMVVNTLERILESSSAANPNELAYYGNRVLKANEKLISTLVKSTDTSDRVSFTLAAVEVEIFMVGPLVTLEKIPRLNTTNSSMDIDLIGIAKNNDERSAAVAFMSYNTMENLLKPDTSEDIVKTMMSTVISATLPKTTNTKLTKPVIFTFRHIREFDPSGSLSCVYWNISEWIVDGCSVLETNSSYTVCSCVHLSTFALMQVSSHPPKVITEAQDRFDTMFSDIFSSELLTSVDFCVCDRGTGVQFGPVDHCHLLSSELLSALVPESYGSKQAALSLTHSLEAGRRRAMSEQTVQEAMAEQIVQEAMAEQIVQEAMAD
ncbi:hypothetical protein QQF64_000002 [Cirrhinus molitorella]|uniref:GAIN-B domain-containing protein n=1 Tax=Cirrhinus molitorella TaxID=172907 RepID=A0ABR3NWC3_9TELE